MQIISRISVFVALVLFAPALFAETEYARNCERVIGVPVPDIDCSSPGGSEISVGRTRGGQCENPSHGGSGCFPGTRFIKYTDKFTRNGKEEVVTTMVMCRKTEFDIANRTDTYSDIGVIQYNETKHATCWYAATANGQPQTKTIMVEGRERRVYPSPNDADRMWSRGQEPSENCLNCHQSGVWLRSPFAMSVSAERGKGFVRDGRAGAYLAALGNEIPDNHEDVAKRGIPCSVGKPTWNGPLGRERPFSVKINAAALNTKLGFPEGTRSGSCTQCHYVGIGDLGGPGSEGGMNCHNMLPEIVSGNHPLRLAGASFAKRFWMPPGGHGTNQREFLQTYGPSIRGLAWCCDPAHRTDRDFNMICGDRFVGRADERRELEALATNTCALCPDCDTTRVPVHAGPGGRTH